MPATVVKKPPITSDELLVMQALRRKGFTYRQIAKETGRTYNGVRTALDPAAKEKSRQATAVRRAAAKAADLDAFYKKERKQAREFHKRNPVLKMLYSAKETAKRKGLPFNLTPEDIAIPDTCPVLGLELERSSGYREENSPSLDRLIPSLGYIKGNVSVISWRANKLKQEGSAAEHFKIAQWMMENGAE